MSIKPKYAVGIDLGTTYSCVGVYRNKAVEIIASEIGERTTPSYVAFSNTDGLLVGQAAKNQAVDNPKNTFFDAKRLIGREYSDKEVQNDIKLLPYDVVDRDGKPYFSFIFGGEQMCQSPEQISSLVLRKMKTIAEEYLGGDVTEAVITVPAYFNDSQRQATKDAGAVAGLNVLRVINEPTAAAIAYGLGLGAKNPDISNPLETTHEPIQVQYSTTEDEEKTILVFDLGGGTFDVSILIISGTFFEVLATSGNTHLGGEDFDSIIMAHFLEQFYRQHKQILTPLLDNISLDSEISTNPIVSKLTKLISSKGLRRLRTACEHIKRSLSYKTLDGVEIEDLYQDLSLKATLSRSKFEDLCSDFFNSCLDTIKNVLGEKKLNPEQIDEIILVGGSTRIPKIRTMLSDYFKKTINISINPDEAVAFGAAIQASILTRTAINSQHGDINAAIDDDSIVTLVDVAPLSLGIETVGNTMSTFIKRNSNIPISETKYYTTDRDYQKQVEIRIFEGERPSTVDNHFLGNVVMKVPEMPAGVPRIAVTFELDQNGLLLVSAVEETSKMSCSIAITNDQGVARLTDEDLKRLIGESEEFIRQDQLFRQKKREKDEIEIFMKQVHGALNVFRNPIKPLEIPGLDLNIISPNKHDTTQSILMTPALENQIGTSLADFEAWYEVNQHDASPEELHGKKDKFMKKMDSLLEPLFKEYLKLGGDPYPNGIVDGIGITKKTNTRPVSK